ncbi:MAG: molybdopterin-dependent oxidoreductase [Negativicutes bacterium]
MSAGIGALIVLPHLLHSLAKRFRNQHNDDAQQREVSSGSGHRNFLHYVIGGVLFVGISTVWKWLNQQAATVKSETVDIFAQCNKMTPAPQPLPDSLPPKGGGYTGKFKVYKIDPQIPCATSADWRFTVSGLVDKPQSFGWEDFLKLPRVVQVSDFHCVEPAFPKNYTNDSFKVI